MISFKGNLATTAVIQQLYNNSSYNSIPASFVELDTTSESDLEAIGKVAKEWREGDLYAADVYNRFKTNYENQSISDEERFFVLTKQRMNFDKLDYSKILGVAELYKPEDGPIEIEFLQTDPTYISTFDLPQIKHVGKAIIESIKQILNDKEIRLFTTPTAKSFYEKMGFKTIESNLMSLVR